MLRTSRPSCRPLYISPSRSISLCLANRTNTSCRSGNSSLLSRARTSSIEKTYEKDPRPREVVMEPSTLSPKFKRLIIGCDGTWMDSDNGFEKDSYWPWNSNGQLQVPSNVTRISRAIKECSADGTIPQIVYYQAGIGTRNNFYDHIIGGGTGAGISENIREAYAFLAHNYQHGDEIFLIGFSRGAFTARSIAGLIASVGLLTKKGMMDFYEVFKDWENQMTPGYVSKFPDIPFANKPKITDPRYVAELERQNLSRTNIPVRAVAVWDTVGSLGIPNLGMWPQSTKEYSFVNTEVSPNIEYAFHALALDEHRRPFSPTIWEQPDGQAYPRVMKQCWFPGVHSNVGGGYADTQSADITMAWMVNQLKPLIDFNLDYLLEQQEMNVNHYKKRGESIRPWGCGQINESYGGLERIAGSQVRTPGLYTATDPSTGRDTGRPLRNTNESIHASVRLRWDGNDLDREDKGAYRPKALDGWTLKSAAVNVGAAGDIGFAWEHKSQGKEGRRVLREDKLGEVEKILLKTSPSMAERLVTGGVGPGWINGKKLERRN